MFVVMENNFYAVDKSCSYCKNKKQVDKFGYCIHSSRVNVCCQCNRTLTIKHINFATHCHCYNCVCLNGCIYIKQANLVEPMGVD